MTPAVKTGHDNTGHDNTGHDNTGHDNTGQDRPEVYRSPAAIVIWWLWVLFAVANLIDLAVQGRDHLSLVAALTLLFITGIAYAAAQRPRVIASREALTIINPLRDHRIDWPAVTSADSTDLLRIRCEWPDAREPVATAAKDAEPGQPPANKRIIYAWAVHTSRRRQFTAELRAKRQAQRGTRGRTLGGLAGGFGAAGPGLAGNYGSAVTAPQPDPLTLDADKIIASLTEHANQARADNPGYRAAAPVATWYWPGIAAIGVSGLALLVIALT